MNTAQPADRRWLYRSTISHTRVGAQENAFSYPGLFICFPLSQRQALPSHLFSLNRFNLFSYCDRDHGDGRDPESWIRGVLKSQGMATADGEVWLMALPRILGFVFNPVSFWYCHDRDGQLRAVLCEVNNTFGERHCYIVKAPDAGPIGRGSELACTKCFHVSPFFPVEGEYRFRFSLTDSRRSASIDYFQGGVLRLKTCITGTPSAMTDKTLLKTFAALGWATLMVLLRIHWQALRLWLKGVRFRPKPEPPQKEISL